MKRILFFLLAGLVTSATLAQEFDFNGSYFVDTPNPRLTLKSSSDSYHMIYEGDTVTNINRMVGFILGAANEVDFEFSPSPETRTNKVVFYRANAVDGCAPGDFDNDGIDDFYELKSPFLDPQNAADAETDKDGDGVSNRMEYRTVTNPDDPNDILCAFNEPPSSWAGLATEFPVEGMDQLDVAPIDINALTPASNTRAGITRAALNTDVFVDVVAVDTNAQTVLVFLGQSGDVLGAPISYTTGFTEPILVLADQFFGSESTDLAVGHRGGQVSFLEGQGDGTFALRPDLHQTGLGSIVAMTHADFDADGDTDLVLSGSDRVTLLRKDDNPLPTGPITNGDFSNGLFQWTSEIMGGDLGSTSEQNGQAVLQEGDAFRVSLSQPFTIPPSPSTVSFDIISANLSAAMGELPDAFEASLLNVDLNSLVPTISSNATSFININPEGVIIPSSGTTFDGTNVVLNISGLTPGSQATLRFNLIGNANQSDSSVVIDNVTTDPAVLLVDTFTSVALSGPFDQTAGATHCDAIGSAAEDIIVEDTGLNLYILYENDGAGGFTRSEFGPQDYGCSTTAVLRANQSTDVQHLVQDLEANRPMMDPYPMISQLINDFSASYKPTWFVFKQNTSTNITLDQLIASSIDVADDFNEYTFPATAGQTIFFNRISGTGSRFNWMITDPASNVVESSTTFTDRGPFDLPVTGDYLLTVDGNGSNTGNYQFQIHAVPDTTSTNVPIDTIISGGIDAPGEIDEYTLSISAPTNIYPDAITGSGSAFNWQLFDPTGGVVFTRVVWNDPGIQTLTTSGTYTVRIDGTGDRTGNYTWGIYAIPSNAPIATAIDTVVAGTLDTPGEILFYTLPITAPQTIYADAISGSGSAFNWRMIDPTGGVVFTSNVFNDGGLIPLSQSGIYTVVIDGSGDRTGNFEFEINSVNDFAPIAFELDTIVAGSIDKSGEMKTYELEITEPENIYINAISGSGSAFNWRLIDPDDVSIFSLNVFNDGGVHSLTNSGTYRIEVDGTGDRTGPFTFELNTIPPDPGRVISLFEAVSDELIKPGQTRTYTFAAENGQNLFFRDMVGSTSAFSWELRDPTGQEIASLSNWNSLLNIAPTISGLYTLVVDGNGDRIGPFSFTIYDVPQHADGTLPLDIPRSGNLTSPGEVYRYTFDVVDGETNRFEFAYNEDSAARLQVLRPNGNSLFFNISNNRDQVFTETGTFTAVITGNGNRTAPFTLRRIDGNTTTPLPIAADLVLSSVTTPERLVQNPATMDIAWTVSNTGTVATSSSAWIDRVMLASIDETTGVPFRPSAYSTTNGILGDFPNATFIEVATVPHTGVLSPGGSYQQTVSITFPPDYEGAFWVFVQTDGENVEFEQDQEANNLARSESLTGIYPNLAAPSGEGLLGLNLEDGATFTSGQTITLSGRARSLPEQVNVFFVVDYSLSTASPTGLDANYDGMNSAADDINGDGRVGDILDAELGAIRLINQLLDDQGVVPHVAFIPFAGGSFRTDFSENMLAQYFWDPTLDSDMDGMSDFDEATLSIPAFFGTEFNSPNTDLTRLFPIAPDAAISEVFYLTDGEAGLPNTNLINSIAAEGINLHAFQIGGNAVSAALQQLADVVDLNPLSSGEAILVQDPNDLATSLLSTLDIAGISVNGRGVASLDAAGNFFTPLTIQPGEQTVEVTAFDNEGNTFTEMVTLIGNAGPGDFNNFTQVDLLAQVEFTNLSYHEKNRMLHVEARITNTSDQVLDGPILVVFDRFSPGAVSLQNFDGTLADGRPYLTFDTEISGGSLAPAATSDPIVVTIEDPEERRFGLDLTLLAEGNEAPTFISIPRLEAITSRAYSYSAEAIDANGDPIAYTLERAPAGMTILSSGAISWTPALGDVGAHEIVIQAADSHGGVSSQRFQLRVHDSTPNRPPVFQSIPPIQVASGGNYTYTPTVYDADFDPVTFSLPVAPGSSSLNTSSGQIDLTAPADGTYAFTLQADDGVGGTAQQSFTVNVGPGGGNLSGPSFLSVPPVFGLVDTPYLYLPLAEDPDGDALSYTLLNGPASMTLNTTNGLVEWTPNSGEVGAHPVQIRVDDTANHLATQFYSIEVLSTPSNLPPVIVSQPRAAATQDEGYLYTVRGIDPEALTLTYTITSGPSGMTIDSLTGELTWTPDVADLGPHSIQIKGSDPAGASGAQSFTLTVKGPNTAPLFTSTPVTEASADSLYQYLALAEDADDPVTYVLTSPTAGLTINSQTGLASWNPTAADIGNYPVTIVATDERGLTATQNYTLTVVPDNVAPSVAVSPSSNLRMPGQTVTLTVIATDNVAVDTVTLTANGAPLALNASGQATFTTNEAALVQFIAEATDHNGNVGMDQTDVRYYNAGDTNPPTLIVTGPANNTMVTAPTNIVGSVFDPDGAFDFYTMEYALASELEVVNGTQLSLATGPFVEFHRSNTEVIDGVLGVFDPTILPNDDYAIRITAWDINGQGTQEGLILAVTGDLKFGQFRQDFLDLEIPLEGVPIRIIRSYDTFNATRQGDFGYGWCLAVQDADIRETVPDAGRGFFAAYPLYDGARVYVTNPDGERIGFTFRLELGTVSPYLGTSYRPIFEPDPGVFETLEPSDPLVNLGQRSDGGATFKGLPFAYNPDVYILTTRDGLRYRYHQRDGLESITDLLGNVTTITSEGIMHSTGVSIQFVRDTQGRITEIVDPDGNTISYGYDAAGNLDTSENRNGQKTTYMYYTDPAHYLASYEDPSGNRPVTLEYDDNGRAIARIDANGARVELNFDPDNFYGNVRDANGNIYEQTFDSRGNLLEEIDPMGGITRHAYDDQDNRILTVDPLSRTNSFAFNARGEVIAQTNALGFVTRWDYNDSGKRIAQTNALGHVERIDYNNQGVVTNRVNELGQEYAFGLDAKGRVNSITQPGNQRYEVEYKDVGLMDKIVLPDGEFYAFTYDNRGNLTTIVDQANRTTSYTYDNEGERTSETDALNQTTDLVLDDSGRIMIERAPDGTETHRVYNPNDVVIEEVNANGGITFYTYDGNRNLTHITDPSGNTTRFIYDELNRMVSRVDPHGLSNSNRYDAVGNLTESTDRNGRRRTFAYDAVNRRTHEFWHAPTGIVRTMEFHYDAVSNVVEVIDPDTHYQYTYDALNRIVDFDVSGTPALPNIALQTIYTDAGRVETVSDNFGVTNQWQRNMANKPLEVQWLGLGPDNAKIEFTPDDCVCERSASFTRYRGLNPTSVVIETEIMYDGLGLPTNLTHRTANGTTLLDWNWEYSPVGLPTQRTYNSRTNSMVYDDVGQLLSVLDEGILSEQFSYDLTGNRLGGDYSVGPNNQLLTSPGKTYTYDGEGNTTRIDETTSGNYHILSYDHRNRLTRYQTFLSNDVQTDERAYTYDVWDRRLTETINGSTVATLWNNVNPWAEFDGNGAITARYLLGDNFDHLLARWRPSDGLAWYLTDHQQTVYAIADADGNIINENTYDAFGSRLSETDANQSDRFAFTGRETDADTGLAYHRARYYAPETGRFMTLDPIAFDAGDVNLYRYVNNAPFLHTDPTGLSATETGTMSSLISILARQGTKRVGRCVFGVLALTAVYLHPPHVAGYAQLAKDPTEAAKCIIK